MDPAAAPQPSAGRPAEAAPAQGDPPRAGLWLKNSLRNELQEFVPISRDRHVTWYTCGPTVYDSAHMGHSRNYVTFDIMRRVLEDWFGYDVLFVMNITDVDDKIILRARRNHLLQRYRQQATDPAQVRANAEAALDRNVRSQGEKVAAAMQELRELQAALAGASEVSRSAQKRAKDLEAAQQMEARKLENWTGARAALDAIDKSGSSAEQVGALLTVAGDALAEWQDSLHKGEVTGHEIFRRHAAHYEAEFLRDMRDLGCREPSVLTRVSDYMAVIVEYVQHILANGFAYQANGSVYFDTRAFEAAGHQYGKLCPYAVGSKALAAEGEADFETKEKRSDNDFALWKAAKLGEPAWESPWGPGRPGWHIECSAMASRVIGARLDIHTGGEDLRFPHHDNELAQAEAYFADRSAAPAGCSCNGGAAAAAAEGAGGGRWVNFWLHSGHLSIEGLKMSKALKNFITIRAVLEQLSARHLRLLFVMSPWNQPMSYSDGTLAEVRSKDAVLRKFFQNIDVALRGARGSLGGIMLAADAALEADTVAAAGAVDARLRDNMDTRGALDTLLDLIARTNKYMEQRGKDGAAMPLQPLLLRRVGALVTRVLRAFGLSSAAPDELGFGGGFRPALGAVLAAGRDFAAEASGQAEAAAPSALRDAVLGECVRAVEGFRRAGGAAGGEVVETLETMEAALDALTGLRAELRRLAREDKSADGRELGRSLLAACDRLRDERLVELGVRMEDIKVGAGTGSVWKLDDPAALRAELEEARRAVEAAAEKKRLAAAQREAAAAKKAQAKEQALANKAKREAEKAEKAKAKS
ncbi:hypothetical protein WJX81_007120 [Elliptochloris bilobata]|uniref:cysteine--tRNA ligase n=1 Tax=Elliptochloris bilobata TaxID=381761 RepID=A0AAW1QHB3_9CHLO